ncbi:hypothetical protein [Flavisolibacter ginsenosidimutans]|uniref:Lipoprotein n=1 Tax=Flavisolibacter ginsenosidimutans TaxID=661481 RepID=A0A5B8ULU5_9BACT|nr:hypothetical protein [Flavisolibacter ginsenosidimutans]QEC57654.1 hypothetical protein FSB75_17675 [Flavisolibacter ginsenosidimutans]
MTTISFRFVPVFLSLISGVVLLSCTNNSNTATANEVTKDDTAIHQTLSRDSLEREAELSFIDACVESSKASSKTTLGDAKAYAHCKCVMEGIKQKYGNTDSTTIAGLQKDTAAMTKILRRCK